jgi:hypothetical protein
LDTFENNRIVKKCKKVVYVMSDYLKMFYRGKRILDHPVVSLRFELKKYIPLNIDYSLNVRPMRYFK